MTGKLPQGSLVWFDMVGDEIVKAAAQRGLPPSLCMSIIERYINGAKLENGFCQGLRVDVDDGALACRTGVGADETADVVIEVTGPTALRLNLLFSADPIYRRTLAEAVDRGELRVTAIRGRSHLSWTWPTTA
ncbi:hypothetical protein [Bradyrhizobium sp. BR 10289]|uniref:hypothetical protein n=1 Tax=Bradyrhizobium sp. BR 10289 TaxID=2749993 RepID=UPI001C64A2EC|nr:hypothetical protein [Bradyrhizobium sp. BR 10289]MBW7972278.1 hypothetical protein [Bradyrhizobium sp. BR 10289]